MYEATAAQMKQYSCNSNYFIFLVSRFRDALKNSFFFISWNEIKKHYACKTQLGEFLDFVQKQANTSRTNNVIVTMGGDFTYMDAEVYFVNLDRLIRWAKFICGDNDDDDNGTSWCTGAKYLTTNICLPKCDI